MQMNITEKDYIVSAIVSVYNCERFIRACLEDLEAQTIADRVEIICVNSGSQQNEEAIIKEFQEKYDNIVYIKTVERETLYKAWNRGIKIARGKYITNANSDDRHRKDAFEILAVELDKNSDVGLVYADTIYTQNKNEMFGNHTVDRYVKWPEPDPYVFLARCGVGPQPMWRKSMHDKIGYFDENFVVAGDYEWWLRALGVYKFKHINEYLGLFLNHSESIEATNFHVGVMEMFNIVNKYIILVPIYKRFFIKCSQNKRLNNLGNYYLNKRMFDIAKTIFFMSITYNRFYLKNYFWYAKYYLLYRKLNRQRIKKQINRVT